MINRIIEYSITNKLIVLLGIIGLITYGSYQVTQLPIDAVPDITDNQVQIITTVPSLGATDIERLITSPIEQAIVNIPGIKNTRSFSRFGLSLVTVVFDDDKDVYLARQQVSERLKIAEQQIPKELGLPELGPVTTGLGEIYQYVVKPKSGFEHKYDITELRTIQDWIIRCQLLDLKGVADVSSFGGKLKQYEIAINPYQLKAYNLTINDVFTAVENNNQNTGGAYLEKNAGVLYIRSEGLVRSISDIENIFIKKTNQGLPILIKDVAEVKISNAIRYGALTFNNQGEVAGGIVMMLKGENSNQVIRAVKERIKQINENLPNGVEIVPFLDRTKMVNSAIHTVLKNLLEGAIIVVLVLLFFLGNIRAALLVASVIPLAMLFAVILMNLFNVSGNLMSLGALDFGLIIDGAVIIVEAVLHQLSHNQILKKSEALNKLQMNMLVKEAATRLMNAAVFGQIIILIVYLPIFTLQGIEGKMFKPMAQTVAFALFGAFILSLTYIPAMCSLILDRSKWDSNLSDKIMEQLTALHQRYLIKALKYPKTIVVTSVILFISALIVLFNMGGEFIPELPEGDFAVETRLLTGTNLSTSIEVCLKSAKILKDKFPEIEKIVGKIGSGEIPTDPMPMNAADLMIILKDKSEWTSASSWNELSEKMSNELKQIPGVAYSFQYPVAMRFNELMTGAKQDIVCKIFGDNLDTLTKYANRLGNLIKQVKGANEIYVEPIEGLPQLVIEYDRNKLAKFGLDIKLVNVVVNTALAGQSAGLLYEDEKRFDIVVRMPTAYKQNIDDVKNILIPLNSNNDQIPLSAIANISIKPSVNQVQREKTRRRIIVGFNVTNRDIQSVVDELKLKVKQHLKMPENYSISYGGAFENLESAKQRLLVAVPIALLLILLLLYFAFNSIKLSLMIFSAIPLSAIGGIYFLAIRSMSFSISAGIGFIALFGVSVLNGIVLLTEFNRLQRQGVHSIFEIVLQGTRNRLRPVLMTAFVASFGFLPMAISTGNGAEVQRPLATVVIGGLLVATFLTLFVLPVLYILLNKIKSSATIKSIFIPFFIFLSIGNCVHAQSTISLKAAIDSALKNNLLLKNQQYLTDYYQQLQKSAYEIPNPSLGFEYGQINSSFLDKRFGITQTIAFPTVYKQQYILQKQYMEQSTINAMAKQKDIVKQITQLFFQINYLKEKNKLLTIYDSLYKEVISKIKFKLQKGDADVIELNNTLLIKEQLILQLSKLKSDLDIAILQFNWLLNTQDSYIPDPDILKLSVPLIIDTQAVETHPEVASLIKQKSIIQTHYALEKARLIPSLNFGYYTMSMIGQGADNIYYNAKKQFQSILFGLNFPVFLKAPLSKIKAEKIQVSIAENQLAYKSSELKNELKKEIVKVKNQLNVIKFYEQTSLSKIDELIKINNIKYYNGTISYPEWVSYLNNTIITRSNYLDAINELNQTIIQINYLTNQ